jgi:acyl carrier protein
MGEAEFFERLSAFLSEKRGEPITVGPATDLLASGAVDSLIMVEILMLVEELTGRPVDPEALEPEVFENGQRLYRTLIGAGAAV